MSLYMESRWDLRHDRHLVMPSHGDRIWFYGVDKWPYVLVNAESVQYHTCHFVEEYLKC